MRELVLKPTGPAGRTLADFEPPTQKLFNDVVAHEAKRSRPLKAVETSRDMLLKTIKEAAIKRQKRIVASYPVPELQYRFLCDLKTGLGLGTAASLQFVRNAVQQKILDIKQRTADMMAAAGPAGPVNTQLAQFYLLWICVRHIYNLPIRIAEKEYLPCIKDWQSDIQPKIVRTICSNVWSDASARAVQRHEARVRTMEQRLHVAGQAAPDYDPIRLWLKKELLYKRGTEFPYKFPFTEDISRTLDADVDTCTKTLSLIHI